MAIRASHMHRCGRGWVPVRVLSFWGSWVGGAVHIMMTAVVGVGCQYVYCCLGIVGRWRCAHYDDSCGWVPVRVLSFWGSWVGGAVHIMTTAVVGVGCQCVYCRSGDHW